MSEDRFDRNERFFGKEGQARLRRTRIAVMGAGGLGSIVIPETALLGVAAIAAADKQDLSESNRNRYFGAWHTDPVPGSAKVELARRHVQQIAPDIEFTAIHDDILSATALTALTAAEYVFGCVDDDGVRFFLNEACLAYRKTLIDLASDVPEPGKFGGRVAIVTGDHGCLHCLGLLDPDEVRRSLSSRELLENEASVYGVPVASLSETGPSVVSMNGVVASLGVTAFMKLVTGMGVPYVGQTYRGDLGTVTRTSGQSSKDCYYCSTVRGLGDRANLKRYFGEASATPLAA